MAAENRLFQTPFSKLLVQVKEKQDYLELYTKFDVLLASVQPPLIKVSFVKDDEWIGVYKSYSIPINVYLSFIGIIIFPQIFATFMGMTTERLFIFATFTLFFILYNTIVVYFSHKKINSLLLKIINKYQ